MPNTIISLENVNGRWVGEVEMGSPVSRREVIRSDTFEDAMKQIGNAYDVFYDILTHRAVHSEPTVTAESPPGPAMAADVPLEPENDSPKLPRGRHKNTCDCPRCEAKRAEAVAVAA